MPSPTITLAVRGTSSSSSLSSSSSTLSCSGKNADLTRCEKPASSNSLEIGLGIGIPVAAILMVLSYFIIRNYRKEKREAMDHDPDFDENGDPTALPDLPAFSKEANPFQLNENQFASNGGYPLMLMQNKSVHDVASMDKHSSSPADPYIDGFVLPYHNQTGSKASLDHFARQLGDHNSFNHQRGVSEYSASINNLQPAYYSERSSPQRSNLNTSSSQLNSLSQKNSPVKNRNGGRNAYNLQRNGSNFLVNINNSASDHEGHLSQPFRVNYENEPDSEHESIISGPAKMDVSSIKGYSANTEVADLSSEIVSIHNSDDESDDDQYRMARSNASGSFKATSAKTVLPQVDGNEDFNMTSTDILSPFDEHYTTDVLHKPIVANSSNTAADMSYSDVSTSVTQDSHSQQPTTKKEVKIPRMSAFNMLQNVSDDEVEDGNANHRTPMTEEQEIELARMKSVYKVYFDRSNSVKSLSETAANEGTFQADDSQPLPDLDQKFKVNSNLTTDTNYDKRKTTTSSIYENSSHMHFQERDHYRDASSHKEQNLDGQAVPSHLGYIYQQENSFKDQEPYIPSQNQQDFSEGQDQYSHGYQSQYPENPLDMQHPPYGYQNGNDMYATQQYLSQSNLVYGNNSDYLPQNHNQMIQQQQGMPLQDNRNQRFYNTQNSRLPNASDIRKSSLQTYTNFEPMPRVSSSPSVKQQEFFSGANSPNEAPGPYNLLSASLMTTGAPVGLQRKFKPAGAF